MEHGATEADGWGNYVSVIVWVVHLSVRKTVIRVLFGYSEKIWKKSDVITKNNRSQYFEKQGSSVIVGFRTTEQKDEKQLRQQIYLFFLITEKKMII